MERVEILVFRHGETDWNREGRLQGHTDIPLNDNGKAQAELIRPIIERFSPQVVFSSDLKRAQDTGKIVNRMLKLPTFLSPGLRECGLGEVEGMLSDDLVELYGGELLQCWASLEDEDMTFSFPGGETKAHHAARVIKAIEDFCVEHPELERIAVSTHGGSVRALIQHCGGHQFGKVFLPNCVVIRMAYYPITGSWEYIERAE